MFSVVIPLFNSIRTIDRTLNSVFNQSFLPSEIIVVDDGSTDGGGEYVEKKYGDLLRVITQPNQGVSAARNMGAKIAQEEYVCFLDADDIWRINFLSTTADLINSFPSASLLSTSYLVSENDSYYKSPSEDSVPVYIEPSDFLKEYNKKLWWFIHVSSACIRRSTLLLMGGFPENVKTGEDVITWIKLGMTYGIAHNPLPCSVYYRDNQTSATKNRALDLSALLTYLKALSLDNKVDEISRKNAKRLMAKIIRNGAGGAKMNGNYHLFFKLMAFSIENRLITLMAIFLMLILIPNKFLKVVKRSQRVKACL